MSESRCLKCGAKEDCGHTPPEVVKIKSAKERRKCVHKFYRVFGVPTWRYLCDKCGHMTR